MSGEVISFCDMFAISMFFQAFFENSDPFAPLIRATPLITDVSTQECSELQAFNIEALSLKVYRRKLGL